MTTAILSRRYLDIRLRRSEITKNISQSSSNPSEIQTGDLLNARLELDDYTRLLGVCSKFIYSSIYGVFNGALIDGLHRLHWMVDESMMIWRRFEKKG
jgi:hypothetical protein